MDADTTANAVAILTALFLVPVLPTLGAALLVSVFRQGAR